MSTNLISVIIPSYNHEKYIKQAVDSVLLQSYDNIELIVVDDGSGDSSLDYLRSVRDPRFQLIEQENSGAHNAINRGLSVAQGEYLSILNSDDAYHPDRLSQCADRIQQGFDLVASWIELIDDKGKVLGVKKGWRNMLPWRIKAPKTSLPPTDAFRLNLVMSNFVSTTSNMVFTRRLFDDIGGMRNLRFAHDWDFLLRAVREYRCELIDRPLLQYRTHQTNTISSNRAWMLFEICWIYAVHLRYFTKEFFSGTDHEVVKNEIGFLTQSINLQGNDKVMWIMLQYLNERAGHGGDVVAEKLLDDERLRREFIQHIVA